MSELYLILLFAAVCAVLLRGFPVAFTLAGVSLLFAFMGAATGHFDTRLLSAFPQRIFAVMTNEVLIAVPLFVFMGVILEKSKIAEDWLANMGKLFGRMPGGLGFSVCIVGALMAASTGIVGATVITMGLLSLPAMMKNGYCSRLATGTICAAGTLGQIIPPSIVLILLGDQLSTAYQQAQFRMGNFSPDTVSVNDLFAGALIPGLVLVGLYIAYQAAIAIFQPHRCPAITAEVLDDGAEELTRAQIVKAALVSLVAPLALIIAVLGSILMGLASPTEAASVGAVGAMLLAGYRLESDNAWLNTRGKTLILMAVMSFVGMLALTMMYDLRMQRAAVRTDEWVAIGLALILAIFVLTGMVVAVAKMFLARDDAKPVSDAATNPSTPDTSNSAAPPSVLFSAAHSTATITSMVFIILVGASMFSLVFRGFGGDDIVETWLANIPGGTITVLLLVMLAMFLMGFILDFLEIIFIVVPIVAPILLTMTLPDGSLIHPVWLGVMMAINLQTSFLTPPFGFSLFYLRGVAPKSIDTVKIYQGVIPFILIQVLMLAVLFLYPSLATWLPEAIYN